MSRARCLAVGAVACALVAVAPGRAHAFCGFFVAGSNAKLTNNASQVVLMRKGNRTVMTMSNNYQGPPENFAMVVPVPVKGLATAPRGKVALKAEVRSPVPLLGIPGKPPQRRKGAP